MANLDLQKTYDTVVYDLELAQREGFCLGLKVVRGAYMDEVCHPTFRFTLNVMSFFNQCAPAFPGLGQVEYKNTIHCRRRVKCSSECDIFSHALLAGVHWFWLG